MATPTLAELKLALIPPGKFLMGSLASEAGRDWDERQHEVNITEPFYLGMHEVTVGQFKRFLGRRSTRPISKRAQAPPRHAADTRQAREAGLAQSDDHPVVNVTFNDAKAFCDWLSLNDWLSGRPGRKYALPSEAQWEYACRAGTETRFFFGDDDKYLGEYAWYAANAGSTTHPVGGRKANPWGLFDMHGNVWEWTADWWGGGYYERSPKDDPPGPDHGDDNHRAARGGAWNEEPRYCRSAYRNGYRCSWESNANTGFRVLCAIDAPSGRGTVMRAAP